jgi:hypothetical protein
VGSFPTEVGGFKPDFWKMNLATQLYSPCTSTAHPLEGGTALAAFRSRSVRVGRGPPQTRVRDALVIIFLKILIVGELAGEPI